MFIEFKKVLKMRRVSIVLLVVLFLLSGTLSIFAGNTSVKNPYKGVTLTFGCENGPVYLHYIREYVPEFERKTGIKVKVEITPIAQVYTKWATEFMANTGVYDIVQVDRNKYPMFMENNWLEPLGKYFEQGLADPSYDFEDIIGQNFVYYKDKLVTLPVFASCYQLYYRTDLFQKVGIEGPPGTYSEEIEYARKLNNLADTYGIAIHGKHYAGLMSPISSMLWSCGGKFFDENWNPVFHQEPGIKALNFYCDLIKYAPPDVLSYGWLEVISVFAEGHAGICHLYPEATPDFLNPEKSRIIGKWDAAITPHREGYPTINVGEAQGLQVAAQSRHKKAAFKFIEFLTSKEIALKAALSGGNPGPCRLSVLSNPKFQEKAFWAPAMAEGNKRARGAPVISVWDEVVEELVTAWQGAAMGKQSPREALSDAADKVRKIVKQAGYLQ